MRVSKRQPFDGEYAAVAETALKWPVERRTALAHYLIDMIAVTESAPTARTKTLDLALGLLRTDRPAPSDEEVQNWLTYNKTKYGG